ncbi:MAG: N-formylglutamate amidohydrolase [Roseobacter sp.]
MPVKCNRGDGNILCALPYAGTDIPQLISRRLRDENDGFAASDHDLEQLFAHVSSDATILRANFHRYLSDVDNVRPGVEAIPMASMIGVAPLLDGAGEEIWDQPPSEQEAASWRAIFYAPYHAAVAAEIARIRARHGLVYLVNVCVKRQAPGSLPAGLITDIDVCPNSGHSSSIELTSAISTLIKSRGTFSSSHLRISDAGWTTRHYGNPNLGVYAFDIYINEACYLSTDTGEYLYDAAKAARLQSTMTDIFQFVSTWKN